MNKLLATLALAASLGAWAQSTEIANPDPKVEARLKAIAHELRCLVCQNQTLADSNAPLAQDLRREVRALAQSGKSDDEIRDFLVARYGDFVLYAPPLKATTSLLWAGPFLLLALGVGTWLVVLRRRRAVALAPAPPGDASARARELLDADEGESEGKDDGKNDSGR